MRKQVLKAVTMLVSIIALAFMTAVVSNAQSSRNSLRANIPFDFHVGDKTLEANFKGSVETAGVDRVVQQLEGKLKPEGFDDP